MKHHNPRTAAGLLGNDPTYRALTVQLLRLRTELFQGGGISRHDFDRIYLGNLGAYERKVAAEEGIEIKQG